MITLKVLSTYLVAAMLIVGLATGEKRTGNCPADCYASETPPGVLPFCDDASCHKNHPRSRTCSCYIND